MNLESASAHMLSAALRYAGAGIHVFPVTQAKTPYTDHGFLEATTDRAQIEQWWTKWPNAGIGTPDFDVVDIDSYKPESEPTWARIKPLIPDDTPCNKTCRGGLQYIFAPGTLRDGRIGPGVDNRYAGRNYIVLPPSEALGGRYETIVDLLLKRPRPAPEFPLVSGSNGGFGHLLKTMSAGEKVLSDRNKATWWRGVEILRTLPPDIALGPVVELVQEWVNGNCGGDLSEVNVKKQVRGAAKFVADERSGSSRAFPRRPRPWSWNGLRFRQSRCARSSGETSRFSRLTPSISLPAGRGWGRERCSRRSRRG